ncbi:sugar phosphate isomerase/epimerase family protein [Furfurilactobacillus sp. WILCCON 0119]
MMNAQQIVLNTLVFADQVTNEHTLQATLLAAVPTFGISNAEIRREYISDFATEIPAIKAAADTNHLRLFYSVPEVLFLDGGQLNPNLKQYFDEAQAMGMFAIKLNIGDFAHYQGDLTADFGPLLATGIQVNIENDQTVQSGSSANILTFLNAAKAAGVDIQYVFDLGNWRFVAENELTVASELAPFTRYIHVKNVTIEDGKPSVTALDTGVIDWQKALTLLPTDVPVALEYPATDAEIHHAIDRLTK